MLSTSAFASILTVAKPAAVVMMISDGSLGSTLTSPEPERA